MRRRTILRLLLSLPALAGATTTTARERVSAGAQVDLDDLVLSDSEARTPEQLRVLVDLDLTTGVVYQA